MSIVRQRQDTDLLSRGTVNCYHALFIVQVEQLDARQKHGKGEDIEGRGHAIPMEASGSSAAAGAAPRKRKTLLTATLRWAAARARVYRIIKLGILFIISSQH